MGFQLLVPSDLRLPATDDLSAGGQRKWKAN